MSPSISALGVKAATESTTKTDRELAPIKDFVNIKGEKAIYQTSWNAAGVEIEWDMVHYDVQLIGGIVLHQGKIAEMQTGEGKTLSATLPIYLNALTGLGVHLTPMGIKPSNPEKPQNP